jgi:hypothetical protein
MLQRVSSLEAGASYAAHSFRDFFEPFQPIFDREILNLVNQLHVVPDIFNRATTRKGRDIHQIYVLGGCAYRLFGNWAAAGDIVSDFDAPRSHDYDFMCSIKPGMIELAQQRLTLFMTIIQDTIETVILQHTRADIIKYKVGTPYCSAQRYLRVNIVPWGGGNGFNLQLNMRLRIGEDIEEDHILELVCSYDNRYPDLYEYKGDGFYFHMPRVDQVIEETTQAIKERSKEPIKAYKCRQDAARLNIFIDIIEMCHERNIKYVKNQCSLNDIMQLKRNFIDLISRESLQCNTVSQNAGERLQANTRFVECRDFNACTPVKSEQLSRDKKDRAQLMAISEYRAAMDAQSAGRAGRRMSIKKRARLRSKRNIRKR